MAINVRNRPPVVRAVVAQTDENYGPGSLLVREFSEQERITRAVVLGIAWIFGTGMCRLIPVFHYVLVPAGMIATPLVVYFVYRHTGSVVGGDVRCPQCAHSLRVFAIIERYPIQRRCMGCKCIIRITQQSRT